MFQCVYAAKAAALCETDIRNHGGRRVAFRSGSERSARPREIAKKVEVEKRE